LTKTINFYIVLYSPFIQGGDSIKESLYLEDVSNLFYLGFDDGQKGKEPRYSSILVNNDFDRKCAKAYLAGYKKGLKVKNN